MESPSRSRAASPSLFGGQALGRCRKTSVRRDKSRAAQPTELGHKGNALGFTKGARGRAGESLGPMCSREWCHRCPAWGSPSPPATPRPLLLPVGVGLRPVFGVLPSLGGFEFTVRQFLIRTFVRYFKLIEHPFDSRIRRPLRTPQIRMHSASPVRVSWKMASRPLSLHCSWFSVLLYPLLLRSEAH